MKSKRGAARLGTGTAPNDAATRLHVTSEGSDSTDSSRRLLVGYFATGRDGPVLDRLATAAGHGRELVQRGADRITVVVAQVVAGKAAGLPRRQAEEVVLGTLRGAR